MELCCVSSYCYPNATDRTSLNHPGCSPANGLNPSPFSFPGSWDCRHVSTTIGWKVKFEIIHPCICQSSILKQAEYTGEKLLTLNFALTCERQLEHLINREHITVSRLLERLWRGQKRCVGALPLGARLLHFSYFSVMQSF